MTIPDNSSVQRSNPPTVPTERRTAYTTPLKPLEESGISYVSTRHELLAEVERQARELRLLHEMRKALVEVNDLEAIFRTAVDCIASIFGYSMVSIYRLVDSQLRMQAQIGYDGFYYEVIPLNQGVSGRVARTGRGVLVENVQEDPDYLNASDAVVCHISVPLLGPGQEVLGTLSIESDESRKLTERDYKLAQALAEHIALALAQALAYERERRRLSQMALLNHVGRDLASSLDVSYIIERVTGPVRQTLNLYSVNIGLIEGHELVFNLKTAANTYREYRWPLHTTNSLTCHSARSGELVICYDVTSEPRYLFVPEIPDTRSQVVIPLRSAGEVIGVLDIESDSTASFEDDDIILLKTLADQTSVALTNARRFADVQRQSQALALANRALAEANRLKSEFLANVSHELRTPLNSIIGYVDMIQTGFYGDITADMEDPLERVFRNGRRLMTLINDILDLANIEAGRLQLLKEEVLTRELMEALSLTGRPAAAEKGLAFRTEIVGGTPRIIVADINRLRQVVTILLSNAVKFTETGEVCLSMYSSTLAGLKAVAIAVSDTGIGIPESEFDHIFEEFRQVDGSSTRQYGGTGLGLALARRLVRQMAGKIEVQSELGRGSTFTVFLPIEQK